MSCLCGQVMKTCLLPERLTDRKPISLDCSTWSDWHVVHLARNTMAYANEKTTRHMLHPPCLCHRHMRPATQGLGLLIKYPQCQKALVCVTTMTVIVFILSAVFFFIPNLRGGKSLQLLLPVCCVWALHILTRVSRIKAVIAVEFFYFICVCKQVRTQKQIAAASTTRDDSWPPIWTGDICRKTNTAENRSFMQLWLSNKSRALEMSTITLGWHKRAERHAGFG